MIRPRFADVPWTPASNSAAPSLLPTVRHKDEIQNRSTVRGNKRRCRRLTTPHRRRFTSRQRGMGKEICHRIQDQSLRKETFSSSDTITNEKDTLLVSHAGVRMQHVRERPTFHRSSFRGMAIPWPMVVESRGSHRARGRPLYATTHYGWMGIGRRNQFDAIPG